MPVLISINIILLLILDGLACVTAAQPGHCDVIAGGTGYLAGLVPEKVNEYVTATTFEELKQYIDAGKAYIFIPGTITITVPNAFSSLRIKTGQTIFSDRGINGSEGALLITPFLNNDANEYPVYEVESKARITGLRIQGPSGEMTTNNKTIGIQLVTHSSHIEIDNNEIYNWPWAGISVKSSHENKVHHNFIHHNIRSELGYGVVVQNGEAQAEIYCNTFDANRHAIAGSGDDGEGYEAHNNLVLPGGGKGAYHQFDMHKGMQGHGGKYVIVNDNIFDYGAPGTSNRESIYIRGVPTDGAAFVNGNVFTQPWAVGTQFAVDGVKDSVPLEDEIKRVNRFQIPVTYTLEQNGLCRINTEDLSLVVNCKSVSSVLK